MRYRNWRNDFSCIVATEDTPAAQVWNLENDLRIPKETTQFMIALGQRHGTLSEKEQVDAGETARIALSEMIEETRLPKSGWLGCLPAPPDNAALPEKMYTHIIAIDLARYCASAYISEDDPPEKVRLPQGIRTHPDGTPAARFIWLTFEPDGGTPTNDPTTVKCKLGLPHFPTGEFIFRIWLSVKPAELFIPTCLDAGLYEAWTPPPTDHTRPWGVTRNLRTGTFDSPEILGEVTGLSHQQQIAELVSAPGMRQSIGVVVPIPFMTRRE